MEVDGIEPWFLNALIDHRFGTIWISSAARRPEIQPDVVITNVNNLERFESLHAQYPEAQVVLFRPGGFHNVVTPGNHHGQALSLVTSQIWEERYKNQPVAV